MTAHLQANLHADWSAISAPRTLTDSAGDEFVVMELGDGLSLIFRSTGEYLDWCTQIELLRDEWTASRDAAVGLPTVVPPSGGVNLDM